VKSFGSERARVAGQTCQIHWGAEARITIGAGSMAYVHGMEHALRNKEVQIHAAGARDAASI